MFDCFEEILMAVIKNTLHDDDMSDKISPLARMRKSDEERFDDAMVAIFGEKYELQFKKTDSLSTTELLAIKKRVDNGEKLRSAVGIVVKDRLPPKPKNKDKADIQAWNAGLNTFYGQARQHFKRNQEHYKNPTNVNDLNPIKEDDIFCTERINARARIFDALRSADWII